MKHIDVFFMVKYGEKIQPMFNKKDIHIKVMMYYGKHIDEDRLPAYFNGKNAPKSSQQVKWLSDKGYSPKTIQEWLQLSQSTVSYHLQNKGKTTEYINRYLKQLQKEKDLGLQTI